MMSKPGQRGPPKGSVQGGSPADKDDAASRKQGREKADLIARMRVKVRDEATPHDR